MFQSVVVWGYDTDMCEYVWVCVYWNMSPIGLISTEKCWGHCCGYDLLNALLCFTAHPLWQAINGGVGGGGMCVWGAGHKEKRGSHGNKQKIYQIEKLRITWEFQHIWKSAFDNHCHGNTSCSIQSILEMMKNTKLSVITFSYCNEWVKICGIEVRHVCYWYRMLVKHCVKTFYTGYLIWVAALCPSSPNGMSKRPTLECEG